MLERYPRLAKRFQFFQNLKNSPKLQFVPVRQNICRIDVPNDIIAILKPNPSSPRILSGSTGQSSKFNVHVDEPLIPSLSSFFPKDKPVHKRKPIAFDYLYRLEARVISEKYLPWHGLSIINALMPLCFLALSVVAKTMPASDSYPFVIQHLLPFNM